MAAIDAFTAQNRFGLGVTPSDHDAVSAGHKDWLHGQVQAKAALFQSSLPDIKTLSGNIQALKQAKKTFKQDNNDTSKDAQKEIGRAIKDQFMQGLSERFMQGVETKAPFAERMALFWSNHFTVSVKAKPFMGAMACDYENTAIRPYIFGSFETLLLSSMRHPAMLIYLDNATSVGPDSIAGQRRQVGLNENLARETLELHSVGVDGGYSQADVIALAKIITGWSIVPPRQGGGGFMFNPQIHEPGSETLMGRVYDENGEMQGIHALRDLAYHPSTARFIATKLVRHFVADNPPPDDVDTIAEVFRRTGGDLAAVSHAVIDLPSAWAPQQAKIKTPYEMIVSTFRLFAAQAAQVPFDRVAGSLKILDHVPFTASSPAGWSDKAEDWLASNSLLDRVEWCHALAQKIPADARINPLQIAQAIIGPVASDETMKAIEGAPSMADGIGLMLASPEFQRR